MSSHASSYHAPAMVEEVLRFLQPERGGTYLDGTLGGGGHAQALLERAPGAQLIGVDRDPDALREAGARLGSFGDRFRLVHANFAEAVKEAGVLVDTLAGVLLDLGISSHQIDVDQRGFTFRAGAPLDMRMAQSSAGEETAADLLNSLSEAELADIFFYFGEERRSRKLARVVVEMRASEPFQTSQHLLAAIERVLPRPTAQDRARLFQALRIAVNRELDALQNALPEFRDALAPGGIMVILSYHSLEDRIVKEHFREWSQACVCPPHLPICQCRGRPLGTSLTRKPVFATEQEVQQNPRARSARLRAWRKA